ncbi:M3 family metallopeptidase [Scleromatobacter humisilvae]|uniref:Zn-dependent oligopeptidase n=1 Tax=Scleromatobacter humisilvae TaxID=2897159 RepID=A0A9X2BZ65_9BURK|nr:M3 family metallopeptidase [Scleromatobacter humisilvae]MCK9686012.1 Zn-dependent oligopeptidase [Scleromatobacter humisilvae]
MKRSNVFPAALALAAALATAVPSADAAPARRRAPAHPKPIPVKPVVENPVADLPFPKFDHGPQVASACTTGLEGALMRVKELEKRKAGADWLKGWENLYNWEEDQSGALIFLQNVHPDADVRTESEKCEQRWSDFQATLGMNEAVYQGAKQTVAVLKDPVDKRAAQRALEAFEDSGVALPKDKQARAKAIADKLATLSQQFNRNIRDARTLVAFTDAELKGVPESAWKEQPRDAGGRVTLPIDGPIYATVMQTADDAGARERLWRAKTNEGGPDNLKLLAQIEQLRLEQAKLFGFASYDEFVLRRRMVESPARAAKFLDDVRAAVAEQDQHDVAELRQAKARHLGQPLESTKLQRWDTMFYSERVLHDRFNVDDEAFRPYFPPQDSLRFVMRVAEKMFGIRYDKVANANVWAPEVQAWAVTDVASNRKIATLFVDPTPRDGKYNRAATWNYRNGATSVPRQAQSALVVNFDKRGLTLRELETLMHEFGHTLRDNLSATRYASDAGENVAQDVAEAPSQMLEDWVYDKKVLKVFQEVCPTCKPVPDDLVDKARAARDFGKGSQVARQQLYAAYDLALHGAASPDPMETWEKMEAATSLGYVSGTTFPSGFAHIAGGYGAGYYGYLWSQAVAADMRTAFASDKLDPKVGARFRATVLAEGAQKPPQQVVKDFLGRDGSSQAFFDWLKK